MQRVLCSAVVSIMSSILLVPQVGRSADDGLCFLRTESGRIIGLDALCLQRSQPKKPMQKFDRDEFIRTIKEKNPDFYTVDDLPPDLKARAVRQGNGLVNIELKPGEALTLPNGDRFEADGSFVTKNGMRIERVIKDGKIVGGRAFKPDGTEMKPGEKYTASDGTVFVMPMEQPE
jgi:hypothetical protein